MSQRHHTKLLIIGAGPAGYTAAIYGARANLSPMLLLGIQPGGQLMITTDVENYPGFADVIQGPWLMEQMHKQAEHVGTRIVSDLIVSVDLQTRPFVCIGDSGDTYVAEAIAICTGAQARWLGLPSEELLRGFGVSACATCDGFFFRGKEVAVVGGGNTAVEEALYLTNHANRVTLIHRRDSLRAEKILQARLFAHPKIKVVWDSEVEEILASAAPAHVTGIRLRNHKSGDTTTLACDGVFIAIGHTPVGHRAVPRPAHPRCRRLYRDPARFDRDRGAWRVRRRRRTRQGVPPGGHRCRHGLHGGARGGALYRRIGSSFRPRPRGIV